MREFHLFYLLVLIFLHNSCSQPGRQTLTTQVVDSIYTNVPAGSPDGIGRLYMGREIAHTMSHEAAAWLDRPERLQEERTDLIIQALQSQIKPTDVIADIGAGSGYFSFRLAPMVPQGKVYAVDIQPEMLAIIQSKREKNRMHQVETVLGTITDPKLPDNTVDWVLLVDTYHEFSEPYAMMQGIYKALKSTGRVVLLEYRAEDKSIPIKPLHKMTKEQIRKEMEAIGLKGIERQDSLPWHHLLIFEKK